MAIKNRKTSDTALPKSIVRLVAFLPPMAIRDDVQHSNTLEVIDRLMQVENLSRDQSDYLETLVELVEVYEAKQHAIELSNTTGLESLRHVLNESGLSGSDLGRLLGVHASMGSKILNGERKLTWEHAKKLAARFAVTPSLFID
jgi:HTH-type transcriptional regulator/antitoxin HigA